MEKLSAESINRLIEDCRTDDEENGLTIPRTFTYPEDVYVDYDKLIDNKERLEDLISQALPFFSTKENIGFPFGFFQHTGERDENGDFKSWTNNKDDLARFLFLGMYASIIEAPKKTKVKNKAGEEMEVPTHKIIRRLKPTIVKE